MYAVVRSGGKQHRVTPGDSIRVEKLPGDIGQSVQLGDVLLTGGDEVRVGTPVLAGVVVVGTITDQGRGPKITIFKKKRRKDYRRKQGHRQANTEIHIDKIEG